MERYDAYYFFQNFKRDRVSFNDYSYVNSHLQRLYSRYFSPMSNIYRWALFSQVDVGQDDQGRNLTLGDFPFGRDWQTAGFEALNFLNQVVEQPEPGMYCLDEGALVGDASDDVYRHTKDPASCGTQTLDVPVGVGKYYYTDWTEELEYEATRIGTYYDKWAAIFAMTDNTGFFYRDASSYFDAGAYALSFWSGDLKEEVLEAFKHHYTGESSAFSWQYDENKPAAEQFQAKPVLDIYTNPTTGTRIEGATSWSLRYLGLLLPMMRYNSEFDYNTDFNNYARVCLEGNRDCLDIDASVSQTTFTNPLTGHVYKASNTDMPGYALAPRLLNAANDTVTQNYDPAKIAYEACFTAGVKNGSCVGGGDEDAEIQSRLETLQKAERMINEQSAFIDIVRQASSWASTFF